MRFGHFPATPRGYRIDSPQFNPLLHSHELQPLPNGIPAKNDPSRSSRAVPSIPAYNCHDPAALEPLYQNLSQVRQSLVKTSPSLV